MEIKRVSIPAIKLEDDCRLPKKINYYKHDAFNVSVLNSTVNQYGLREWKIAFDTKIETTTGSVVTNATLMNKLVKILPLDIEETATYVETPKDVAEVLSDVLDQIDEDSIVSVFIHKDFFKIMKELEVDDISKFLSNYISKEISETIRKDWSRAEIRSRLKDVFLELSTLMDVKCQAYLNSKYMSPITTYLLLDYILTPFKSGSAGNNIKFFREMILALSRDMFYQTKIENVLGMLNYNKSNLGPLSWMVMDILEKDKMNTNPIYAIEKLAHIGVSNLWLTEKIGRLLYDKYEDYDSFTECTYGENFDGMSNAQVSQTTGLYLTQNPKTIASYSVPEDLRGNAIDQIDITIQKDSLRTMNYKKISSRIDKLEEDAMDIQNYEDKDSLLETAKFIASDIYDIQNQDEDNYPEMDRLLTKLQEVITTINNAVLGEPHDDLVPESEARKRGIGHAVMAIPTAIIDRFNSLPDYKTYSGDEEDDLDPQRRGKNRAGVFTKFFMGIEEIVDKCIPEVYNTHLPLVGARPTGRMYNQHLMNKMKRKERMTKKYNERRKARGYRTNYESFVEGFVHYGLMPFSEADIIGAVGNAVGGVVKGGQDLIQAGKNAWRWNTLKKAFHEAEQAIEYIRVRSGADDHALRRLAMDHIKYWESAAERIEDEGPESRELAKNIKKELNRFREKYANKIKISDYEDPYSGYSRYGEIFNAAFEAYMDKLKEDYDPDKEYTDENGELPREKVEQMTEFGDSEDSLEKEETVEELEDTILDKLRDRGALNDEDKKEESPYGEVFGIGGSKSDKSDSEKMADMIQKDKEINEKMAEAKANDDMDKYWKLQDEKWQNWSYMEDMKAIPMGRMKDITKAGQPYIVFHRGATDFGKIITWWTKSPFSHTDVVIDNRAYSSFIDTLKVSVKLNPNASVVVYELSNIVDKRKFKQFLVEEGNKKYGLGELIKAQVFGIPTKDKAKFQAYFCSQYITAALDYATDRKLRYKGKPLLKWGYDYFNPKILFYMLMSIDGLLKNKTTLK